MLELVFLAFKAFILSGCVCKTFASGIIAKRVLVTWSFAFTDPAAAWQLTPIILLGHGGDLGKSISFTWKQIPGNSCVLNTFLYLASTSDVWNFPFCPFICFWTVVFLVLSFYLQFLLSEGSLNALRRAALHMKARLSRATRETLWPIGCCLWEWGRGLGGQSRRILQITAALCRLATGSRDGGGREWMPWVYSCSACLYDRQCE